MDKYRPEYRLDRLRMTLDGSSSSCDARQEGETLLRLRWLRTMVVDLSHTAERDAGERLGLQRRRAVGCAVERVVCKDLSKEHFPQLLPLVTQCVLLLTSLDLRGCNARDVDDDFLLATADAHGLLLQRLYLPLHSSVAQSTLDRFTQLEELDASGCRTLTNVNFCSATLRVLYANDCVNLTIDGLWRATRLEVLHVGNCRRVFDVTPFAQRLLELDASYDCRIGSRALSNCRRLQVLRAEGNARITTLQPFAQQLRELNAVGRDCALDDAALADATGLVSLSAYENPAIRTVAPFGASLRRLDASCSKIGDAGLVTATNLVYLNASKNDKICSLVPISALLLELRAYRSSISQIALSAATNLIWLDVSCNKEITTVESCGRSLRHLVAWECGLTNDGVCTATQLVTLDCRWNRNLTTMVPFLHSLEELCTYTEAQCLEVSMAAYLHFVKGKVSRPAVGELERNGFIISDNGSSLIMHRNTVTYELK